MKLDTTEYPVGSKRRAVAQLKSGALVKALKTASIGKIDHSELAPEIKATVQRLCASKNFGTVLSAVYEYGAIDGVSVDDLLSQMLKAGDTPGFLKQVFRFSRHQAFPKGVEDALRWHEERRLPDAYAWRVKFQKLAEQDRLKSAATSPSADVVADPVRIIHEAESIAAGTIVALDLKPLRVPTVTNANIDEGMIGTDDAYIISQVSRKKMEQANRAHSATLHALCSYLKELNCNVRESKLIDAYAVLGANHVIFEVKSINEANEREQVRKAISQLFEYRFLYSIPNAVLCAVFSSKPVSQWLIDYLVEDRGVLVLWVEGNTIAGESVGNLLALR